MLANKLNYGDTIGVVGVSNSISNRKERLNQFYQAEQFLIDKGFKVKEENIYLKIIMDLLEQKNKKQKIL